MDALNFSANGVRWRVVPITREHLTNEHVPALPGAGLLFTSAEGEMRFLLLDPNAVPSLEFLKGEQNAQLGAWVQRALPVAR